MKKFIISAIILACLISCAYAEIHEFKYFSLNIPYDWTANEKISDDDLYVVSVLPNDKNLPGSISIISGNPGDLTAKEIAEKYSHELNGTQPESDDEIYNFEYNGGNSHAIVTSDENFYMFTTITGVNGEYEINNILLGILDSLEMK